MRSVVPLLLIVLACNLGGCVANGASPSTAFADRQFRASGIVVAQKPISGADVRGCRRPSACSKQLSIVSP
jgi:hypothetical protein